MCGVSNPRLNHSASLRKQKEDVQDALNIVELSKSDCYYDLDYLEYQKKLPQRQQQSQPQPPPPQQQQQHQQHNNHTAPLADATPVARAMTTTPSWSYDDDSTLRADAPPTSRASTGTYATSRAPSYSSSAWGSETHTQYGNGGGSYDHSSTLNQSAGSGSSFFYDTSISVPQTSGTSSSMSSSSSSSSNYGTRGDSSYSSSYNNNTNGSGTSGSLIRYTDDYGGGSSRHNALGFNPSDYHGSTFDGSRRRLARNVVLTFLMMMMRHRYRDRRLVAQRLSMGQYDTVTPRLGVWHRLVSLDPA